jgi:predicted AAA+ superfamily ATPase
MMKKIELESLILFDNVRRDTLAAKTVEIAGALYSESASPAVGEGAFRLYYEVQRGLLAAARPGPAGEADGTYWRRHVSRLVAESENAFSLSAERGEAEPGMRALAAAEMPALRALYAFDWKRAAAVLGGGRPCAADMRPPAARRAPVLGRAGAEDAGFDPGPILRMADDAEAAEALAAYYARAACGAFGRYAAFYWRRGLVGVERPDPVCFDDLIGYESQKEKIIENTAFFLSGRPYSNMLLYGDRGTGKSSSVKALLNRFGSRGLRLVALPKAEIDALPALMDALAPRGCKFIVFIDDLSFEENETGYKAFKSALEGGVHAQPANILVCVTSNRRNIVKEVWREREDLEEINLNDALQEKRSLADRFGLTVTFSAPNKSEYLDIVRGIARRAGLAADDALARAALQWELRQGGRSGRAARQFVNRTLSGRDSSRAETEE